MNRVSKVFFVIVLTLLAAVQLVGAQEQSIIDIIGDDARFDTFSAAVFAAELDGALSSGEWTVFAPTDDAFAKKGLDAGNITTAMSKEELTDLLLYHAMTSSISSVEAKTILGDLTMANGKLAGLKNFNDSLWVNDEARVIEENIIAANGTIHIVDTIIDSPWPGETEVGKAIPSEEQSPVAFDNSIATITSRNERFSTLAAAMAATGLDGTLSSGEWTVFAPTDDAFATLGLDAGNIATAISKEDLTDFLLYHTLTSSVSSAETKTLLGDMTMANGKVAGLKFFGDSLWANDDSRVIFEDVNADNGTIHVVNHLFLGPWPHNENPEISTICPFCTPIEVICRELCIWPCAPCGGVYRIDGEPIDSQLAQSLRALHE